MGSLPANEDGAVRALARAHAQAEAGGGGSGTEARRLRRAPQPPARGEGRAAEVLARDLAARALASAGLAGGGEGGAGTGPGSEPPGPCEFLVLAEQGMHRLEQLRPRAVVMYDPDVALTRRLELYQASAPPGAPPLRVYVLRYEESAEMDRYQAAVVRERRAFESLIKAKEVMTVACAAGDPLAAVRGLFVFALGGKGGLLRRRGEVVLTGVAVAELREGRIGLNSQHGPPGHVHGPNSIDSLQ